MLYLALCMPVSLQAFAGLNDAESSFSFAARGLLISLRIDGLLAKAEGRLQGALRERYGKQDDAGGNDVELLGHPELRPFAKEVMHRAQAERIQIHLRIGMEEASSTAMASGAARAFLSSLVNSVQGPAPCEVEVEPDFQEPGFVLTARCIFFVRAGDLILAALKTAVKKLQREGLRWTSIPLKA